MPGQGKKPGKNEVSFHVSTLEVKGGHRSRSSGTVTAV